MKVSTGHVFLRRGSRGRVWYAKFRLPGGQQVQKCIGRHWDQSGRPPAGYLTKRLAESQLRELLADAQRGSLPLQNMSGATFGEACAEWLRYVEFDRERTRSTVSDYRSVVDRALLPALGESTPIEEVTMRTLDAYRAGLASEGRLSNRTINKHLVILHGIFKRAQRVWELPSNPASAVERQPVRNTGRFNVLSPVEIEALARAAETEQDSALFKTAAFTGLRLGELRALEWADVEFDKRLIHVRKGFTRWELGDTKSHKVRSVPMIDQVMEVLEDLAERPMWVTPEDLVFPSTTGFYFDDSRLRRRYKKALADAELEPMRFHDLRHTFGTIAVQAFPLSDVKAFMGHADIQTTMIYVHHVPQHDAAERLSQVVSSETGLTD